MFLEEEEEEEKEKEKDVSFVDKTKTPEQEIKAAYPPSQLSQLVMGHMAALVQEESSGQGIESVMDGCFILARKIIRDSEVVFVTPVTDLLPKEEGEAKIQYDLRALLMKLKDKLLQIKGPCRILIPLAVGRSSGFFGRVAQWWAGSNVSGHYTLLEMSRDVGGKWQITNYDSKGNSLLQSWYRAMAYPDDDKIAEIALSVEIGARVEHQRHGFQVNSHISCGYWVNEFFGFRLLGEEIKNNEGFDLDKNKSHIIAGAKIIADNGEQYRGEVMPSSWDGSDDYQSQVDDSGDDESQVDDSGNDESQLDDSDDDKSQLDDSGNDESQLELEERVSTNRQQQQDPVHYEEQPQSELKEEPFTTNNQQQFPFTAEARHQDPHHGLRFFTQHPYLVAGVAGAAIGAGVGVVVGKLLASAIALASILCPIIGAVVLGLAMVAAVALITQKGLSHCSSQPLQKNT